MTTAERQAAYRARKSALGQKPITMLLTPDEQFYLKRVLEELRETGSTPAMMRRKNGTLYAIDL